MTAEQYGIVNLINSFMNVSIFIVGFSLYTAIIRFYVEYKDDNDRLKDYISAIVMFISLSSLIFITLGVLFNDLVVNLFFEGIAFFPYVLIGLSSLIFVSLHSVHQSLLRAMQNGKKLVKLNVIFFFIQVILNVFFLLILDFDAEGILLSTLITNILYLVYMCIDLYKNNLLKISFKFRLIIPSLKYSIPIIPHDLSLHVASLTSKILTNKNESTSEVGLYGLASQFSGVVDMIQASVNTAFQPWFYENMKSSNNKTKSDILSLSHGLLLIYSVIYISISLFAQEVVILFAPSSYIMSWTVIPIIIIGYSIKSIYYFYLNLMLYHKKASRFLFLATVLGSLIDIILAIILIPRFGIYGSAFAFLFAKLAVVIIIVFVSKNYNNINYNVMNMLRVLIPSYFFIGLGLYFSYTRYIDVFNINNFLFKTLILGVYLLYLLYTNKRIIVGLMKILKSMRDK